MESILTSIKKLLGINEEYTHFDIDIIMYINSALGILTQMGVGPSDGYSISDKESTWSNFITDMRKLEFVKTYIYLKVRLDFDPPTSASHIDVINRKIQESEWRISVQVDPGEEVVSDGTI